MTWEELLRRWEKNPADPLCSPTAVRARVIEEALLAFDAWAQGGRDDRVGRDFEDILRAMANGPVE